MKSSKKDIFRIVDANFNRAKEGLRVCEDVCRFILDDKSSTRVYKDIRHGLTKSLQTIKIIDIIKARDIDGDVGKTSSVSELKRKDVLDIFYANSQRAKESMRVLEELLKLLDVNAAKSVKLLRYKLYGIEKKVITRF